MNSLNQQFFHFLFSFILKNINLRDINQFIMERKRSFEGDITRRRIEIRNRLRRDEIEEYFDKRRKEMLQLRQDLPSCQQQILSTAQNRQNFLLRIEAELRSTSPLKWLSILKELKMSIGFFEGDFDPWTRNSIIQTLTSVIKVDSSQFEIQMEIIKLFTKVIINSRILKCNFVGKLVYYGAIQNAINFINCVKMPLLALKQFLHFFACLCRVSHKLKISIINLNGGDMLQAYGDQLISTYPNTPEQQLYNFLGICGDFVAILEKGHITNRFYEMASGLLPIVLQYLETKASERVIKEGLRCLYHISKLKNAIVYKRFEDQAILNGLFEFSRIIQCRPFTMSIMSQLTCNGSNTIIKMFYRLKIFDFLLDIIRDDERNHQFLNSAIIMINNLVVDEIETKALLLHPIWEVLIGSISHFSHKVRQNAYHCINSIVTSVDSDKFKLQIIHESKITKILIDQIADFKKGETDLLKQAFYLLKKYIQLLIVQKKRNHLQMLDSIYRLDSTLELVMTHGLNDEIVEEATRISQIYAEGLMQGEFV